MAASSRVARSFMRAVGQCLPAVILALGIAPPACAQSTPPAVLPQIERLAPGPQRPPSDDAALPRRPALPREMARPADDLSLDITAFAVDGGPPELAAVLPQLTSRYTGPGRSYEDLIQATNAVTRYLQAQLGHYLGFAYLPEQRPQGGVIRIAVLDGRLDRVTLVWDDKLPVRRDIVEAYLARLRPGSVLKVAEVERTVFLVNDLRGIDASFEFREGSNWGTAELVVTPRASARWQHRVDLDSDGSRYSGETRVGWQASWDSPLLRGDGLTLNALASFSGGLAFGLVGYTTPVGADGLKLGGSLSAFRYHLDRELLPLDVNGTAVAASAYALYPNIRSRNLNLFSLVSLEHKRFADRQGVPDQVGVDKQTTELRLALSGDLRDDLAGGAVSTYELAAHVGRLRYTRNAPTFTDDSTDILKLGYGFSRLQNILPGQLLAYLNLRGQAAFVNLDSTQQFRLGGADGVRAFAPGEAPGDSGLLLSLELRWLPLQGMFGDLGRQLVFSVFYDAGRVQLRHDSSRRSAGFVNHTSLSGAGVGVAWDHQDRFNLRLYLGEPISGQPTGDTLRRHPRVYALLSAKF